MVTFDVVEGKWGTVAANVTSPGRNSVRGAGFLTTEESLTYNNGYNLAVL